MNSDIQDRLAAMEAWQAENPLRVWRDRQGLSMRQAAPLIDTNFNSIQDWEQGQYVPNAESFRKIQRATGITEGDWQRWHDAKPTV
jgi:ribosome-binding protein aMBF1 (putative translation factor)